MNKPLNLEGATAWEPSPNNLEPFWMGFTPNRAFKKRPRMIARAKDMHYYDMTGRPILASAAGSAQRIQRHCTVLVRRCLTTLLPATLTPTGRAATWKVLIEPDDRNVSPGMITTPPPMPKRPPPRPPASPSSAIFAASAGWSTMLVRMGSVVAAGSTTRM